MMDPWGPTIYHYEAQENIKYISNTVLPRNGTSVCLIYGCNFLFLMIGFFLDQEH